MHRISYLKHFIDGTLAGLTVQCSFTEPEQDCCHAQAVLNSTTQDDPAWSIIDHATYWISGVSCDMGEGYETIQF